MRTATQALLLLALGACSRGVTAPASPALSAGVAQVWVTTPDRQHLLERQPDVPLTRAGTDTAGTITLDTATTYQVMEGFGAAITDAAAELVQQRLAPAAREALLRELFGADGAHFDMARVTLGASDFSRSFFTYDDAPAGTRDDALAYFSIDSARTSIVPLLRSARAVNPQLTVLGTPWSAPAWMKTSGSLIGGTLRPDAFAAYAQYLARTLDAFAQAGVPIDLLTVQNEPHNEPKDYPGMRLEAAQRATLVGQHLGPLLERRGLRTQLLDWDHNWDEPQSPLGVLADADARRHVRGVAWHCYGGDVQAQSRVHDAYPDLDTYFTECAGGEWAPEFGGNLRWNVKTLVIGATRNWARGVVLWNLALDSQHGPHRGGCNDCRGVLTIDSASGRVTRNEEYYALAHASRFVRRGAVRIASPATVRDVSTVAFRNAGDRSLVLVAVNEATAPRTVVVQAGGRAFPLTIPAGAVATATWR